MSFLSQFEQFDPKEGCVPARPFFQLPEIAQRARLILCRRSRLEIAAAAERISVVIDSYFDDAEQCFIDDQLHSNGWACKHLAKEACNEAGLRDLISHGLPDTAGEDEYFDFPTKDNTTELQALKDCVDTYDFEAEELKKPRQPELFAVLALWYVGDCVNWLIRNHQQHEDLNRVTNPDKGTRGLHPDAPLNLAVTGREALMAMDSVCYAEHLLTITPVLEQLASTRNELNRQMRQVVQLANKKAAERQSEAARQAAFKRHQEHARYREEVIRDYEKKESSYKSIEAAARTIAKQIPIAHRTIVEWIRVHKKTQRPVCTP